MNFHLNDSLGMEVTAC